MPLVTMPRNEWGRILEKHGVERALDKYLADLDPEGDHMSLPSSIAYNITVDTYNRSLTPDQRAAVRKLAERMLLQTRAQMALLGLPEQLVKVHLESSDPTNGVEKIEPEIKDE